MKKNQIGVVSIALCLLTALEASALAAPGEVRVYSNVCYNSGGGDVLGTQITLLDMGAREMFVIYGEALGSGPSANFIALVADDYDKVKKGQLAFEGPTAFVDKEVFLGRITDKEIILTAGGVTKTGENNNSQNGPIHLKRVKLPVPFPEC